MQHLSVQKETIECMNRIHEYMRKTFRIKFSLILLPLDARASPHNTPFTSSNPPLHEQGFRCGKHTNHLPLPSLPPILKCSVTHATWFLIYRGLSNLFYLVWGPGAPLEEVDRVYNLLAGGAVDQLRLVPDQFDQFEKNKLGGLRGTLLKNFG